MDLHDIETILKRHEISGETYAKLCESKYFQTLVLSARIEWESGKNTQERTKIKAGSMIEQWLLRANKDLHDGGHTLTARTELAKVLKSIAGMGERDAGGGGGERFSVTINLGDSKIKLEKQVTSKVIEHEPTLTEIV